MSDAIAHRGPDGSGVWVDAATGIALSHRRLAVIDLTEAGAQPMVSSSGRYVLSFNGEVYNLNELRRRVAEVRPGLQWRGHSDTEVLVEAIEQWGLDAVLPTVDGMFALAVWDRKKHTLSLARDRFGEKPLYYGLIDGDFLFGSELRAIRSQARLGDADIDMESLEWLFQTSYIPSPRSIFRQIRKLPPASLLTLTAEDARAGRTPEPALYWDVVQVARQAAASPFEGDDDDIVDRLDALLNDSLRSRLIADVPVGAMLSGGIDSTCMAAVAQSLSGAPLKTFTIGFDDASFDESGHAAKVAQALGTDHTTLNLGSGEILDAVLKMGAIYDEPFADSSQVPTFLVSRALRQRVTVAISGDAGDELFGGYNRHAAGPGLWRRLQRMPLPARTLAARALSVAGGASMVAGAADLLGVRGEGALRWQKAYGLLDARSQDDFYARLISHWPRGTRVSSAADFDLRLLPGEALPSDASLTRRMMLNDTVGYLPNDILTKVDRASMAVALETRVPFLSPAIFEFSWSLPTERLIRDGVGKQPLRRLAQRYVPASLIDRPKQGFSMPVGALLRGPLKEWAGDLLSTDRLRSSGLYNTPLVEKAWRRHLAGTDNAAGLWPILMFEAWRAG